MMISCRPFRAYFVLGGANRDLTVAVITLRPCGPSDPSRIYRRNHTTASATGGDTAFFPNLQLYDCRPHPNATLTQSRCNLAYRPGILVVPTICFANEGQRNWLDRFLQCSEFSPDSLKYQ
jgi:hypothetical protein